MRAVIPSEEQVIQWITSLSNWGRWGEDDQYGCLNLITPEKRQQAAMLCLGPLRLRRVTGSPVNPIALF